MIPHSITSLWLIFFVRDPNRGHGLPVEKALLLPYKLLLPSTCGQQVTSDPLPSPLREPSRPRVPICMLFSHTRPSSDRYPAAISPPVLKLARTPASVSSLCTPYFYIFFMIGLVPPDRYIPLSSAPVTWSSFPPATVFSPPCSGRMLAFLCPRFFLRLLPPK